jgi:hypothetical protein
VAGKNHAIREVLVGRWLRLRKARIDVTDKSLDSVLLQSETWKKTDIAQLICVFSVTHIQLPLCKLPFWPNIDISAHVLAKVKGWPNKRSLKTGSNDLG